jgi:hypothetical protein
MPEWSEFSPTFMEGLKRCAILLVLGRAAPRPSHDRHGRDLTNYHLLGFIEVDATLALVIAMNTRRIGQPRRNLEGEPAVGASA